MKKALSLLMALVMVLTLFAGCGTKTGGNDANTNTSADSDYEYIKGKGELIIGITYFEPMNYEKDGELTGFETEFAKAVCAELGVNAKFQEISWSAKESELAAKNIDCIWNGLTITPERQEAMSITTPYMRNKQMLIVKEENASKYLTAESLAGASVVAEKESAGEEVATTDEFFKNATFTAVDTQAKALMEVKSGTADICVIDYVAAIGSTGEGTSYEDLVMVDSLEFSPEQYGVAFRKGSDMTAKVNEAMQKVADSGKLKEIAEKYKLDSLILL